MAKPKALIIKIECSLEFMKTSQTLKASFITTLNERNFFFVTKPRPLKSE
jgi:hypothetical protein